MCAASEEIKVIILYTCLSCHTEYHIFFKHYIKKNEGPLNDMINPNYYTFVVKLL